MIRCQSYHIVRFVVAVVAVVAVVVVLDFVRLRHPSAAPLSAIIVTSGTSADIVRVIFSSNVLSRAFRTSRSDAISWKSISIRFGLAFVRRLLLVASNLANSIKKWNFRKCFTRAWYGKFILMTIKRLFGFFIDFNRTIRRLFDVVGLRNHRVECRTVYQGRFATFSCVTSLQGYATRGWGNLPRDRRFTMA